jgi:integrase/recombinase XerD
MLSNLFQQFVKERIYLKGVTKKTVIFYGNSWASFEKHHSGDLSKQSLKDYVTAMRRAGIKPVSCNTYISCINAFLRWLHEEEHHSDLLKIQKLRVEKRVLKTFSEAQLRSIITFKPKTFTERRIHTLLCLLIDTGLRINEALTIKVSSVDLDNLLVTVRGKGNKERIVPFGYELRKVLFRFMKHGKRFLFPVRDGGHLEYHNARRDFGTLMVKLGIDGFEGTFHACRRAFAKNYIRRRGNLFYLRDVLGHESVKTTEGYVEVDMESLQEAHSEISIMENFH